MRIAGNDLTKLMVLGILAVIAVAFVITRVGGYRKTGEEGASVWFYDQSEKRLYKVSKNTVPPDKGIGGLSGDGVRAVVVAFREEQNNATKRRIAYLETYTPALKSILEKVAAARASGEVFKGNIPSHDSDYFQTNCLVKTVEETQWHIASSPEGRKTVAQWHSWTGPDGKTPVVCVP